MSIFVRQMTKRNVNLAIWAFAGVPAVFALTSYLLTQFMSYPHLSSELHLVVWIAALVLCITSGLKALLNIIKGRSGTRVLVCIVYALLMYAGLMGVGFIAMCAYDCV